MQRDDGNSTRSVHLGCFTDALTGAVTEPIVHSSAFAFPDLQSWDAVAKGESSGDIYSRNSNPTVRAFSERVAALEGAEAAGAFSTGMAAISTTLLALLRPGQRAITVRDAYGATFLLFTEILPSFGVDCVVCDTGDEAALDDAIRAGCDLLYLETPTNPTLKVVDLERYCGLARGRGGVAVVDNTFATPINQQPITLGADLVIHSATKFLCGHGDALGGVVCGSAGLMSRIERFRELTGPSLDAQSAFLLLRSLKTLGLRVQRQNDNALGVARFLQQHPAVATVFYPGLPSHPGHEVAARQMAGFGGVLSFALAGGMAAAQRVLPRLRLARLAPNLGQVETIVGPAFLTSHVELSPEERAASGVPDHLVRYAVGIEDLPDLQDDLEQALGD